MYSDRKELIRYFQYIIRACVWLQTAILMLWSFFSIIPYVGNVLNTEAGFHSVSHLGFWLSIEIFTLAVGGTVISESASKRLLKNTLTLYMITLICAIAANIIHIVASILEYSRDTSALTMAYPLVLGTLTCLYGSLALLEMYCIYLAYMYRRFLK